MAVIVCGAREIPRQHHSALDGCLCVLTDHGVQPLLIHGAARGVDSLAGATWLAHQLPVVRMPAQWDRDGKQAGPLRNEAMLDVLLALGRCGYKTAVHAFPGPQSRGTWHMVNIAKRACVEVVVHDILRGGA